MKLRTFVSPISRQGLRNRWRKAGTLYSSDETRNEETMLRKLVGEELGGWTSRLPRAPTILEMDEAEPTPGDEVEERPAQVHTPDGATLRAIGEAVELSAERVRHIESELLHKLRQRQARSLDHFLAELDTARDGSYEDALVAAIDSRRVTRSAATRAELAMMAAEHTIIDARRKAWKAHDDEPLARLVDDLVQKGRLPRTPRERRLVEGEIRRLEELARTTAQREAAHRRHRETTRARAERSNAPPSAVPDLSAWPYYVPPTVFTPIGTPPHTTPAGFAPSERIVYYASPPAGYRFAYIEGHGHVYVKEDVLARAIVVRHIDVLVYLQGPSKVPVIEPPKEVA